MLDRVIVEFDTALRTVFAPAPTRRPLPGADAPEVALDESARRHVAALMRVNHVGEVCAQALYQGQALTARTEATRHAMRAAAWEETEHLNWTEARIQSLGGRKSFLNPLWYAGSLAVGLAAGLLGDRWNLGFLAETELQVGAHLDGHLKEVPIADEQSRAILTRMRDDELQHREAAIKAGAAELPPPVRWAMRLSARVMTRTAYYV